MAHEVIQAATGTLPAPIAKPSSTFIEYLGQVGTSSTAQMIAGFMDSTDKNIGILIIDNEAGFDSMYIPPSALKNDPPLVRFSGGIAVVNIESTMKIKGQVVPLGVSMMHELGHAKQYVENPAWFENTYAAAMRISSGPNKPKLDIENDNVTRHEAPILKDLGLPFRTTYD
jgi:hypothetical protein